ncbi:MAG: hypothetical protein MI923_15140 [Phycisphaerales bacterium]|nr:hypothetical protein [Phycisphaerales bacterium]
MSRSTSHFRRAAIAICGSLGLLATSSLRAQGPAVEFTEQELRRIRQHSPLGPAPSDTTNRVSADAAAARFGQFLFFDSRLSANGRVSCATCHDPNQGFADSKPLAQGLKQGTRHSPTLWNVAYNRWFFWDGRADSLWAQAMHPIESPLELGFSRLALAHLLGQDEMLRRRYEAIFERLPNLQDGSRFPKAGRPVPGQPEHSHHIAWTSMKSEDQAAINRIFVNVAKALAAYEARLVSRRSAFDIFVEGLATNDARKKAALTTSAQRGLKLFIGRGNCRLCHNGPNFTDGEFHNTRVAPRHGGPPRDAGRFAGIDLVRNDPFNAAGVHSDDRSAKARVKIEFLTNVPDNWGRFKTPTLRNVAKTAPYMHQGQFATLRDVIQYYSTLDGALPAGHHKESILVPLNLKHVEIDDLLAFLDALTDEAVDPALLRPPSSP